MPGVDASKDLASRFALARARLAALLIVGFALDRSDPCNPNSWTPLRPINLTRSARLRPLTIAGQNFFGSRRKLYVAGAALQANERAVKIEKQGKVRGLSALYADFRPRLKCVPGAARLLCNGATYNSPFSLRFHIFQNDSDILLLRKSAREPQRLDVGLKKADSGRVRYPRCVFPIPQ
jgi:hypothetical protein